MDLRCDNVPLLLCVCTALLATSLSSAQYVLDPATLSDNYGNTADNESSISWAELNGDGQYTGNVKYVDGMMEMFVTLTEGFVNGLQPQRIDKDLLIRLYRGKLSINEATQRAGPSLAGYGSMLVLGSLFMLVFPFVALTVCCCRLRGKCGGRKLHLHPSTTHCYAFTAVIDCLVTSAFIGTMGMVLMNERMSYAVDTLNDQVSVRLDDLSAYLNATASDVEQVFIGGVTFTTDVITRDLENVDVTLGVPIQDYIGINFNVYAMFDEMEAMETRIDLALAYMQYIEGNRSDWEAAVDALEAELFTFRQNSNSHLNHPQCGTPCDLVEALVMADLVETEADPTAMPDLQGEIDDLQAIHDNNDLGESVQEGRQSFDNIPEVIKNNSQPGVNGLLAELTRYREAIEASVEGVEAMRQNLNKIENLKNKLKKYSKFLDVYDSYRNLGFLSSVVLVFIVMTCFVAGVVLGPFFYHKAIWPTERHSASNCAGLFLMAGTGLIWILGIFFMLVTVAMFAVGYPLHKFVCEPLTDPDYKIFPKLLDKPGSLLSDDGYFMGEIVFGNGSIPLTLSGVLKACRKNKSVYEAMMLEKIIDFDLVENWEQYVNMTYWLGEISAEISGVQIMSSETETILLEIRDSLADIDYDALETVVSEDVATSNLTYVWQLMVEASVTSNNAGNRAALAIDAAQLAAAISNQSVAAETLQSTVYNAVMALRNVAETIPDDIDRLIANATAVEDGISAGGTAFIGEVVDDFNSRIVGAMESYSEYVTSQVTGSLSPCRPVWRMWKALVKEGLCDQTITSFNGVWFCLAWCNTSLLVASALALKLAKFFLRMRYESEDEIAAENDREGATGDAQDQEVLAFDHFALKKQPRVDYLANGSAFYTKTKLIMAPNAALPASPPPAYVRTPRPPNTAWVAKRNLKF